MMLVVFMHVM